MLAHSDEVSWEHVEQGELHWERQRLGVAAGTERIGLSRYRIPAGARCMPVHVHVDEEEFVVVLSGSGLSWQDGATYAVAAGDVLVHRADAEAHTLVAAEEGLDVLIFGSGSPTGLTRLPRAGVVRIGSGLMPPEVTDPLEAELAAGPLDVPPASILAPANLTASDAVPAKQTDIGCTDVRRRDLGRALGSVAGGLVEIVIAPGAEGHPPHCHTAEEELFVVQEGDGELRLGWPPKTHALRAGHVVSRRAGTREAHSFRAGDEGLVLLAYGTRDPRDVCFYPRSGKVAIRGAGIMFRPDALLDYWDGEA